jgi:hypothetical protein
VVTLLCGTGAITAFTLRSRPTPRVLAIAGAMLTVGVTISMVGVQVDDVVLAAAGTLLSGVGFGAVRTRFASARWRRSPHRTSGPSSSPSRWSSRTWPSACRP